MFWRPWLQSVLHVILLSKITPRYFTCFCLCLDSPDRTSTRTHREHCFPQFLYCCLHNYCYADVAFLFHCCVTLYCAVAYQPASAFSKYVTLFMDLYEKRMKILESILFHGMWCRKMWQKMYRCFGKTHCLQLQNSSVSQAIKQTGRAIAQAVSRRFPTAAARVQTRVWSCGILW
jgi:hypothetical protein